MKKDFGIYMNTDQYCQYCSVDKNFSNEICEKQDRIKKLASIWIFFNNPNNPQTLKFVYNSIYI